MRRNERALLVAALVFGAGLVAVVAAGGRRWAQTTNQQGHPRAVVIGALALTALLLGWRLVRAVRSMGGLRPRGLPRAAVVLPAALAVAALVTMTFVYLGIGHRHDGSVTAGRIGGRVGDGVYAPGGLRVKRGRVVHRSGLVYWLAGTGGLAVLAGVAGTAYWLRRRRREGAIDEGDEAAVQLIGTVLDESIEGLRRERDPRRVVIACYARMEQALSSVGLDRAPPEAPLEYLERVLRRFRATDEAVRRLTALFEEAKFSDHVVNERMREDAIGALSAIRRDLRAGAQNAPATPARPTAPVPAV